MCLTYAKKATTRAGIVRIYDFETCKILLEQDCDLKFGYNKIKLNNAFSIGDKPILIGYEVMLDAEEKGLGIDPTLSRNEEGCYLMYEGNLENYVALKDWGNWAIKAWVSTGSADKSTNVHIRNFAPNVYYLTKGEKGVATAVVHNLSSQAINELTCQIEGVSGEPFKFKFDKPLAKGAIDTVKIEQIPVDRCANMKFHIAQVNNVNNPTPQYRECSMLIYAKNNMPKRQHLFEKYRCNGMPFNAGPDFELEDVTEWFKGSETKFNVCDIHMFQGLDKFATDETELFRANAYNNIPAKKTGTPTLALNRIPFEADRVTYTCWNDGRSNERLEKLDNETYSFYDFKLELANIPNSEKIKATVNVTELEKIYFDDMALTLMILEDSVEAKGMIQPPSNPYFHNNLFIKTVNGTTGTPLQFNDGKFTASYEIELPEPLSGKKNNFSILATIGRQVNVLTPISAKTIFDSRVASCKNLFASGINSVVAPNGVKINVTGRNLNITGDYDKVEIWNAAGQAVSSSELSNGMYIVRVTTAGVPTTHKLIVQ